ncbi:MAG: hypothetical protein Q4F07_01090 [Bacteroidales bacterium]|nr:hypothetical protein [Bacteroidales bacterium]
MKPLKILFSILLLSGLDSFGATGIHTFNNATSEASNSYSLDFNGKPNGIYSIILIVDKKVCDSINVLVK